MHRLDPYFKDYNKIDESSQHEIFYMEAQDLINKKRIDIIVKYYYIKARESGENMEFAQELYKKHIEAFSDGTFTEEGNKDKNSIERYIETFDKIIDSFKEKGFDEEVSLIPVGRDREILDGSHRVACAIYFNSKVKVIQFKGLGVDYGFGFFRQRVLDEFYLDFIAKEYVNLKKDVYAIFAWPRVGKDENIEAIEDVLNSDGCDIIYKKKLKFDREGLWNLVFNTYKEEHWIGYKGNGFKRGRWKLDSCYDEDGDLIVYILECDSLACLTSKKESLREYFGLGKASIHSADTHEEVVEVLDFLLDEDYDKLLYENFLKEKEKKYDFKNHLKRKARYGYRITINMIKRVLARPV